jgi:multidrug efflux pump subunit AcrA (membrane-fusion protein)
LTSDHSREPQLLLAAALVSAMFVLPGCGRPLPADETAPPATVKWQGASELSLEGWTELIGSTLPLPDHIARVSAAVEARVRTVLQSAGGKPVAEGQHVDKGTVIVQLEDSIIRSNLAKLEAAQKGLEQELLQSRLALELAKNEIERLAKLKDQETARGGGIGAIPLVSIVDQQKAEIALRDANSKLKGAEFRITAGLKEMEALREQLRFYTLTAPISGRIGRIQVVPGQTLSVGTPVAEVIDLDNEIDVLCFVPSGTIRKLQLRQSAKSGPVEKDPNATEIEADGHIAFIAEQAEPETGNFAVKVRFNNKAAHLRANRVLRVSVLTKPPDECIALPETAVMEDEDPPTVVIAEDIKTAKNKEGKEETTAVARRLQVELGVRDRRNRAVEIRRLTDPEPDPKKKWHGELKDAQFIIEGAAGLQTGDPVKLAADED